MGTVFASDSTDCFTVQINRTGERLWRHYLSRWTAWNHVRTVTSTAATVTLVLAG